MNTKHTSGPWRAYESSDDGWFNIEAESDGSDVVGCEGCANEANARLIAAAPELLAALKLMRETYPYTPPCWGWQQQVEAHKTAKEAIAKATGEYPNL